MKIVLYLPIHYGFGGAERRLLRIMHQLMKKSKKYCAILQGDKKVISELMNNEQINPEQVFITSSTMETVQIVDKNLIKTIWFFNFDKTILYLFLLHKQRNIRLVMTVANYYYSKWKFASLKEKMAFSYIAHRVDVIDCLYPGNVAILKEKLKNKEINQTPLPFTKLDKFIPGKKEKIIVFAGRMLEIKNPLMFIDAISLIADEIRKRGYTVYMCGAGKLSEMVKSEIDNKKVNDFTYYLGNVDLDKIFCKSSVFVSLQTDENYPSQALLEAIACGNYIIASNVGDTYKLIEKEFGALISLSREEIAESILHIMSAYNEERVVKRARNFAETNFDIDKSVDYFERIL